jgi:hypothetical protein
VPQKPGGDRTLDLRGLPFFCNRDNLTVVPLRARNQAWFMIGQIGVSYYGNKTAVLDTAGWKWTIGDDDSLMLQFGSPQGFQYHINAGAAWISERDMGFQFGGASKDNPADDLYVFKPTGATSPFTVTAFAARWGSPSFQGAEKLRYVSGSTFARKGKGYVYGGGHEERSGVRTPGNTLYEIDVTVPSMRVVSVNALPIAVRGEAVLADWDPMRDRMITTDGKRVQVYDFASDIWADVPVNTPADPDRESPSSSGGGRQGQWSTLVDQYIIVGGHGRTYGLVLKYGVAPK